MSLYYSVNLSGLKCAFSLCSLNCKDGWKCCNCSNCYHEACAIRANAKIKRNTYGVICVLACEKCPINIEGPISEVNREVNNTFSRSSDMAVNIPSVGTVSAQSAGPSSGQVNFVLDENTKVFLSQFKNEIIEAFRVELRQYIAVVNQKLDVVEKKLTMHSDLCKILTQRVAALEEKASRNPVQPISSAFCNN